MQFEKLGSISRRRFLSAASASAVGVSALGVSASALLNTGTGDPLIIGHRGAAGLEPPNTMAGIKRALDAGADGVELDVRRTRDDELVLFHDFFLDLSTNGHGLIETKTLDELRDIRIDGEPLLTLDEALTHLETTEAVVVLELKSRSIAKQVVASVESHDLEARTTIVTFDAHDLEPATDSEVDTGLIGSVPRLATVDEAKRAGCSLVMSHYVPGAMGRFLDAADRRNISGGIWSLVTTETSLEDALAADPDIITTNRPDLAVQAKQDS